MSDNLTDSHLFPQVGDLCYHYKHDSTNLLHHAYQIICIAKQTETEEELVIYKALYNMNETLILSQEKWEYSARPYSMFIENVVVEGQVISRFKKITDQKTLFAIRKALLGR